MISNTAIFYDIENLLGIFSGKTNTTLNLDEIYRRVLEMEGVHGVSIQRAYADWALQQNRALQDSVLQVGIEPIQIFNTNQNDRVKNAADVCLIIDAVELLSKRPEIENYVIASGDGIFAFLSKKLHEHGKRVIGCGFDRNSNVNFRNSCDYYVSLEKADKALVATTSSRRKNRTVESAAVTVETAPAPVKKEKMPIKFPKTKYSEMISAANIAIWRDTHDLAGGLHTIRKIVEAIFVEEVEGLGDLEISVFKTYVDHYVNDFKPNRYSYSRFGEFMQFVLTGSPFCLYTIDESVCKIARRGAVAEKGTVLDDVKGLVVTAEDGSRFGSIFSVPEEMAFIYTIVSDIPASEKKHKRKKPETKKVTTPAPTIPEPVEEVAPVVEEVMPVDEAAELPASSPSEPLKTDTTDQGSLRKWIKGHFMALAESDGISAGEARLLVTPEYSKSTFGVKIPILKEIETRSNLLEQRSVRGRVKYWKETFMYNGKHYLVYKDWVASAHRARFIAWLESLDTDFKLKPV
ncbi:MAG: NYN domain-containing protein [Defluviitaleaceae bacterium]|nr:NYN domain-containing protein [Defluviitaleaceae bacterium]